MKAFNDQMQFKNALMKKVHCTVIIIQKKKKKTKFSHMEIGISRVYNVLIVLENTVNQFIYINTKYNYNIISFKILGTLRSSTETATKTSLQNVTLHNPKSFLLTWYNVGEIVLHLHL